MMQNTSVGISQKKGTKGGEIETLRHRRGGECGGGVFILSQLGSLGKHRKLPQQGPGLSPGQKLVLVHFEL